MCKFRAERIIKETLTKNHCRFIYSRLEDGLLKVCYVDVKGDCIKAIFPYRYMNEEELIDRVMRRIY